MSLQARSIIIIGGGVAGLTAAIALARSGASVSVLERAPAITEVGAGLQISPNGMVVLRALGLGPAMEAISIPAQAICLRDYKSVCAEVLRLDLTQLGPDMAYRFVHRADLVDMLHDAAVAAGVRIETAKRAVHVHRGRPASVALEGGESREADLILGADGLHSVVRPTLNGPEAPFFTNHVAWRALVPNRIGLPNEARLFMGPGRHLVAYPLRDGALVNIVAVEERSEWAPDDWTHRDDPARLRAAFADFGDAVPVLLDAVEEVGLWGLFRHPVAQRWYGRGVAVLGDAAHPTLPFMAQGANLALEDAWVLADCLAKEADQDRALARYQVRRRPRVLRVVSAASGNARKYHLRNSVVRGMAHFGIHMLGKLAPARMMHQFDWIYAHDVTREPS